MANDTILEIVSNSDFKVFLDQGGDDRNQLSKILAMSDQEFHALADPEPGQCLIVWGDKILQCDSKISRQQEKIEMFSMNSRNRRSLDIRRRKMISLLKRSVGKKFQRKYRHIRKSLGRKKS